MSIYGNDKVNYAFNWKLYKRLNPSLNINCQKEDEEETYERHWLRVGKTQGLFSRMIDKYPGFDWREYKRLNSDLHKKIQNNQSTYEIHYIDKGIATNRIYKIDLSCYPDFNIEEYKRLNPDLHNTLTTKEEYELHWITKGCNEGRVYSLDMTSYPDFNVKIYKLINNDLKFDTDEQYIKHFLTTGIKQGRRYILDASDMPDFNVEHYKLFNPDLNFKTDIEYKLHFYLIGNDQNRLYKLDFSSYPDFDLEIYKKGNPDLELHTDLEYRIHFLVKGKDKNRLYKLDFSSYPDFDLEMYKRLNPDLQLNSVLEYKIHFLLTGSKEDRMYKLDESMYRELDIEVYKNLNTDLLFKNDNDYIIHYLTKGKFEGRIYNLDMDEYPDFNVELFKILNKDLSFENEIECKKYWLTQGKFENRLYKLDMSEYPNFDVELFKKLNKDLILDNEIEYKKYWLTKGHLEGRLYTIDMNAYNDFDWYMYKKLNPDISLIDSDELYIHYYLKGKDEGRHYKLDRESYPNFNWELYRKLNPNLDFNGIMVKEEYEIHWMNVGSKIGRHYQIDLSDTPNFDPRIYKSVNKLEIDDIEELQIHWMVYGKNNNLVCNLGISDYPEFNADYYKLLNIDLEFKTREAYEEHWLKFGRYENRNYKIDIDSIYPGFHWIDYKDQNIDLIYAGLRTKEDFELHWLKYGKNEGRFYKDNNISLVNKLTNNETLSSIKLIAIVETSQYWNNIINLPRRINGEYIKQPHDDIGYYNILDKEHRVFMRKLAIRNNIYGFCYNYNWSSNKNSNEFMDKLLQDDEPNIPFMVCWKNDTTDVDHVEHFKYLLNLFSHVKYIKINNKPVIVINDINYHNHEDIVTIINLWSVLAKEHGLDGIYVMMNLIDQNIDIKLIQINAYVELNPMYATTIYGNDIRSGAGPSIFEGDYNEEAYLDKNPDIRILVEAGKLKSGYDHYINIGMKEREYRTTQFYTYDGEITYDKIIEIPRKYPIQHTCINVGWNNIAKRSYNNKKYNNYPHMYKYIDLIKFKKCFRRLIEKVYTDPNSTKHNNFIFINSWNCWSEGSALEPNDIDGYNYIESIGHIFNTQLTKKGVILHIGSKKGDVKLYIENLEMLYPNYNHICASSIKELQNVLQEHSKINLTHIHDVINTDIGWDILESMDSIKKKCSKIILTIHDYRLLYPTHTFIDIDVIKHEEVLSENMKRTKKMFSLSNMIIFPNDSVYDNYCNYIVLEYYDDKIYIVPHNDIQHTHNSIWIPKIYDYTIKMAYIQNESDKKELETVKTLLTNHTEYNRYKIEYIMYNKIEDIDRDKVHGILQLTNNPQTYSYELTKCIYSGLPIFYRKMGVFRARLGDCEKYIGFTDDNLEAKLVEFIKYIISNANSYEYTPLTTNIQPNRWYIENYID
jgi:hypothetical protein